MKLVNLKKTIETALLSGIVLAFATGGALSERIEKKGKTSYVTHFVFHPLSSIDVPNVGKATVLEAVGPTENMKGEKMLDKMKAKCTAVSIDSAGKKYIDGACQLTDGDGDIVFSTFDTRDLDKSQPEMDCGTHIITGARASTRGSRGVSRLSALPSRRRLASPQGRSQLTSHTTRHGRSSHRSSECGPPGGPEGQLQNRYGLWQPTLALRALWHDGPRLDATFESGRG